MTIQNRKLKIAAATAAILYGVIIFIGTAVYALWYSPEKEITNPDSLKTLGVAASSTQQTHSNVTQNNTSDFPIKIIIPKIGVDAKVQKVGITLKGNMSAPHNFTDVGWYKYGTVPGNLGSAVMDGHVDNGFNLDGVFKHLKDLKVGDNIFVDMQNGTQLHFVVEDVQSYYYKDTPMDEILNKNDGAAHLNLITCDGTWLPEAKTNDRRLVVYTKLVND